MSEATKRCPQCGQETRATASFCTSCGTRFADAIGPPPPGSQPPSGPRPLAGQPTPGRPPAPPPHAAAGETRAPMGRTPVPGPGPGAVPPGAGVPPAAPSPASAGPPARKGPLPPAVVGVAVLTVIVVAVLLVALIRGGGEKQPTSASGPSPSAAANATPAPTPSEPTPAPGQDAVRIERIAVRDGRYVVDFEAFNYAPKLPGTHVHFFFNTVPPGQAGVPGKGPWQLYPAEPGGSGASPFTLLEVSDRPGAATQMCVLVANPDHSVRQGTGNCRDLP